MTLVVLAALLSAQDLLGDDPSKHLVKEDASVARVRTEAGRPVLSISERRIRFRRIAVRAAEKMTLSLECSFEGDVESIEDNPRFEIFTRLGKTSPRLPRRELRFLDKEGKAVGTLSWAMVFRGRRAYVDVFHPPLKAESMQLILAAGPGIRLDVFAATFKETPDEGALNPNPAFKLGLHNYSGWENISRGGKLITRAGKTVLDTKYGSTTRKVPLPGPGRYAFSARATGNGFNSVVRIRVYNADGKKLMEMATRRYGPQVAFVPPDGAATASFLVYSCLLEEVRLVRLGDE